MSFQVALGPEELPQLCNQRVLQCPGKSLLLFTHTRVWEEPRICQSLWRGKSTLSSLVFRLEIHTGSLVSTCWCSHSLNAAEVSFLEGFAALEEGVRDAGAECKIIAAEWSPGAIGQ